MTLDNDIVLMLYTAVLKRLENYRALCFDDVFAQFKKMYPDVSVSRHKLHKYWGQLIKAGMLVHKPTYEVYPEIEHLKLPKKSYYIVADARTLAQKVLANS